MDSDIGKNRFYDSQPLRVYLAPLLGVNLCDHLFGEVCTFSPNGNIEGPVTDILCPEASRPESAPTTVPLIAHVLSVKITRVLDSSDFELEISAGRADIAVGLFVVVESLQTKSVLPFGPIPSLGFVPRVPPAEEPIRDIGIDPFLFTPADIGPTMIIGVGRQDLSRKVILTVADELDVLFGSLKHWRSMLIILTLSKGLSMNDDLKGQKILAELMIDRFIAPRDEWYDSIRQMDLKIALMEKKKSEISKP